MRQILAGTYVLSSDKFNTHYKSAMEIRSKVHQQLVSTLQSFPIPPTENEEGDDPTAVFVNDVFTVPISLAGLLAKSIPYNKNKNNNSAIGLQIIGSTNKQ